MKERCPIAKLFSNDSKREWVMPERWLSITSIGGEIKLKNSWQNSKESPVLAFPFLVLFPRAKEGLDLLTPVDPPLKGVGELPTHWLQ